MSHCLLVVLPSSQDRTNRNAHWKSQHFPLTFCLSEEDEGVGSCSEHGYLLACSRTEHAGLSMATRAGCVPGAPRVQHNAIVFALLGPSAIK